MDSREGHCWHIRGDYDYNANTGILLAINCSRLVCLEHSKQGFYLKISVLGARLGIHKAVQFERNESLYHLAEETAGD